MSFAETLEKSPRYAASKLESAHNALNHDFCPWMNRWVYWMKHPLAVLSLLLVTSMLCGIYVNQAAYGLAVAVLILVVLGIAWPWISLKGVECQVEFDRTRSRVGQPIVICIQLRNRWPFPVWGLELKKGFVTNENDPNGIAIACLWGWSAKHIHWHFEPIQRGVYPRLTPTLETSFPFGLIHRHLAIEFVSNLIVWPKVNPLRGIPETLNQCHLVDRFSDRQTGDSGDLVGVRSFRQGDSLRRVHWGQTARHGRLIVTERQAEIGTKLRIVPDLRTDSHRIRAGKSSLESMIEAIASIATHLFNEHQYAEFIIDGKCYCIGQNDLEYRAFMDTLARLPVTGLFSGNSNGLPWVNGISTIELTTALGERQSMSQAGWRRLVIGDASNGTVWEQFTTQWRRLCRAN